MVICAAFEERRGNCATVYKRTSLRFDLGREPEFIINKALMSFTFPNIYTREVAPFLRKRTWLMIPYSHCKFKLDDFFQHTISKGPNSPCLALPFLPLGTIWISPPLPRNNQKTNTRKRKTQNSPLPAAAAATAATAAVTHQILQMVQRAQRILHLLVRLAVGVGGAGAHFVVAETTGEALLAADGLRRVVAAAAVGVGEGVAHFFLWGGGVVLVFGAGFGEELVGECVGW